jgi:hypothetical protein
MGVRLRQWLGFDKNEFYESCKVARKTSCELLKKSPRTLSSLREPLETPPDQRLAMLVGIAKALTRRLLQDNPVIGVREVSKRVALFVDAVRVCLP